MFVLVKGQVGYPQEVERWSKVSAPLLYVNWILSTNYQQQRLKAVPFSKSDWTLSPCRADSASVAKK